MKNPNGFTLVEVMVASIIFSMVMLSGLAFFSLGQKPAVRAQEKNFALQEAGNCLETAKAVGISAAGTTSQQYSSPKGISFTETLERGPISFQCQKVTCTVSWNSPGSGPQSVELVTYISFLFPYQN